MFLFFYGNCSQLIRKYVSFHFVFDSGRAPKEGTFSERELRWEIFDEIIRVHQSSNKLAFSVFLLSTGGWRRRPPATWTGSSGTWMLGIGGGGGPRQG